MDRRDFLKASAVASASSLISNPPMDAQRLRPKRISLRNQAPDSVKTRLATRELLSGLRMLKSAPQIDIGGDASPAGAVQLTLRIEPSRFRQAEQYEIASSGKSAAISAAMNRRCCMPCSIFWNGRDWCSASMARLCRSICRAAACSRWRVSHGAASPRFAVRGLLPWPDFLNCISVYNDEDFNAYFAAMLRMRFNMFGMHVYTQNDPNPMAESYLSFEFAGSGHRAALEDTTMRAGDICRSALRRFKWARRSFSIGYFWCGRDASGGGQLGHCGAHDRDAAHSFQLCRGAWHPHRHWI